MLRCNLLRTQHPGAASDAGTRRHCPPAALLVRLGSGTLIRPVFDAFAREMAIRMNQYHDRPQPDMASAVYLAPRVASATSAFAPSGRGATGMPHHPSGRLLREQDCECLDSSALMRGIFFGMLFSLPFWLVIALAAARTL
jgi:hypothetical protein